MKTFYYSVSSIVLMLLSFVSFTSNAQIQINSGVDPEELVEMILSPDVPYDNVQYNGADIARGTFMESDSTYLGFSSGVFLTSGAGYIIPGPNSYCSAGTNNGLPGDDILAMMAGTTTYDAAVLQFDFIAQTDTFRLNYIFGSEEYNEYVGSTFNDVFAILITGPNPLGGAYSSLNIATIPGYPIVPVAINNVNNGWAVCGVIPTGPCTHCEYFTDNTNGEHLEYDAFTTLLPAVNVVPNEAYHIKIAIADAGDHIFDSGLLLGGTCFPDFQSFSFLMENNPQLTEDITGTISEGTVLLSVPLGTDVTNLVATFDKMLCTKAYIDTVQQFSDSSHLDFTEPVIYSLVGTSDKEWTVVVDILTSIESQVFSDVKIYPNPASDEFRISNLSKCSIKIRNSLGAVVKHYWIAEQTELTITDLAPGFYFIELGKDGYLETRKVVVK